MRKTLLLLVFAATLRTDAAERADLSRLVVVGDSLSAGFQNGSLLDTQQPHGYASLIAVRKDVPLPLPLIGTPGIPNVLTLLIPGPLPVIVPAPGISVGRTDIFTQTMNLAVPGANVQDALTRQPDFPIDSLTDLVLGLPGLLGGVSRSQVEWAEALAPTTILVWLGNNDALGAAMAADPALLTPVADFQAAYTGVISRLRATGATLVVANIPDVTVIPFLTSAEKVAAIVGLPLSVLGPSLGIAAGDFVTPDAFPLIQAMAGPLPPNVVLTASEVLTIQAAVDSLNTFIAAQAQENQAALVDIHALTARLQERGQVVGGQRLSTDFLGGIFSLDGIHPTNTGYAIVANEFIHELNTQFAAGIPPVSVEQVAKDDPLVLPGVGQPASSMGHMGSKEVESLRTLVIH